MLLSETDIKRLERAGYARPDFVQCNKQGFVQLRNKRGYCIFYDMKKHRCRVYRIRPSGCRIYPVLLSEQEGIVADDLCPMRDTLSKAEIESKGRRVIKLLGIIDREAEKRRHLM
jgi:Fe-S-cluster containining protein